MCSERGIFCEEIVVIPKGGGHVSDGVPNADEADVWLAGMMFDSRRGAWNGSVAT